MMRMQPYHQFSPCARRAIGYAIEEATRRGHTTGSPLHLLIGVIDAEDALVIRLSDQLGLRAAAIREIAISLLPNFGAACLFGSWSPPSVRVFAHAESLAVLWHREQVEPVHLFLAASELPCGLLNERLAGAGFDLSRLDGGSAAA